MKAGMMKGFFISGTLHFVLLLMVFTIVRSEVNRPKVDISFLFRETQEDPYSYPSGITPEPLVRGRDDLQDKPSEKIKPAGSLPDETPMSQEIIKEAENPLPFKGRDKGGDGVFSDGAIMSLRDTKEHENVIPVEAGIQNDSRDLDSHFRGNDVMETTFSSEMAVGGSTDELAIMAANDSEGVSPRVEATGGSSPEEYGTTEQGADSSAYDGLSTSGTSLPSEVGSSGFGISIKGFISHIESMKWYPYIARRKGIEGTVLLKLRLDKYGELVGVDIKESSGHTILDHAAVSLLKKACPFRHGMEKDIAIEVPVTYALVK